MAALCLVEVPSRYAFGGGLDFYDELAGYLLVWLTFLGAAMARRDGAHIGIRDLVDRLPPSLRRAARIAEHGAMLALHLALVWFGTILSVRFLSDRAITMNVPMGAFYAVIPLAALPVVLFEIRGLLAAIRRPETAGTAEAS